MKKLKLIDECAVDFTGYCPFIEAKPFDQKEGLAILNMVTATGRAEFVITREDAVKLTSWLAEYFSMEEWNETIGGLPISKGRADNAATGIQKEANMDSRANGCSC